MENISRIAFFKLLSHGDVCELIDESSFFVEWGKTVYLSLRKDNICRSEL